MEKYWFTHNICIRYIQNITCDKPIKKACHQKINRILFIYLLRPTTYPCLLPYLPIPTYLPTYAYLLTYLPTYPFLPTYQMAGLN